MSSAVQLNSAQLLPIKAAAELVPYSRDYVARLAREGKVVAVQIDRQWFIDVTSLQNFLTNATIEDLVRKRHLSVVRKRELEMKETYRERLDAIAQRHQKVSAAAVMQTCLIVVCGLAAGGLLGITNTFLTAERGQSLALLPVSQWMTQTPVAVIGQPSRLPVLTDYTVVETNEELSLQNGIVLLPASASSSATTSVSELFSDPVIVVHTGTSTGIIRIVGAASVTEFPFIVIPPTTSVAVEENSKSANP